MGAQESAAHLQGSRFLDAANHAQHLQLVLSGQSVAALDFHRTRSLADNLVHTAHRLAVELVLRKLVQTVGRVQDASPSAGYLSIAQAVDFVNELLLAAAGIDDVGVAVAERRHHGAAFSIDDGGF